MQLYPAIDMKGGKCVRLTQGLFDNVKVYSDTPADMAKLWVSQGASFLHIVDLDGALAGHSVNEDAIRAIVSSVSVPIELGGGIRSAEAVKNMLDLGITRCIIGMSKELGTRHRAGVGISEITDSLTIIVSEETGKISVAYEGELERNLDADSLRDRMHKILNNPVEEHKNLRIWKGRSRDKK